MDNFVNKKTNKMIIYFKTNMLKLKRNFEAMFICQQKTKVT